MVRPVRLVIPFLILILSFSAGAAEDEGTGQSRFGTTSGNVGITSDYLLRGISQTDHQPAIQGGFDWKHPSGVYLGTWGSSVHMADAPATVELDFYGGYLYRFTSDWSAALGALYYSYFQGSEDNALDLVLKTTWRSLHFEANYSPRWQAGQAWYLSAGWTASLPYDVTLGLYTGYSFFTRAVGFHDYGDFRVSFSREFLGVDWEVSGVFVSRRQFAGADDPRVIFGASRTF